MTVASNKPQLWFTLYVDSYNNKGKHYKAVVFKSFAKKARFEQVKMLSLNPYENEGKWTIQWKCIVYFSFFHLEQKLISIHFLLKLLWILYLKSRKNLWNKNLSKPFEILHNIYYWTYCELWNIDHVNRKRTHIYSEVQTTVVLIIETNKSFRLVCPWRHWGSSSHGLLLQFYSSLECNLAIHK